MMCTNAFAKVLLDSAHAGLLKLRCGMGVHRNPCPRFLKCDNLLNKWLGVDSTESESVQSGDLPLIVNKTNKLD